MELYVFLRAGRRASLDDVVWPAPEAGVPGAWAVSGEDPIRAYPLDELLWWLDDELWAVELEGDLQREGHALVAERGRLLNRIEEWNSLTADNLVEACAFRVRDAAAAALDEAGRDDEARAIAACQSLVALERVGGEIGQGTGAAPARLAGFAADTALYAREAPDSVRAAAVAAYVAAHALAGGDKTVASYEARFADERRWQAEWLSRRLRLND